MLRYIGIAGLSACICQTEAAAMSGRPYARNLRAPFAGATDLEATLPHAFRLPVPRAGNGLKDRAIRSAIRRRCMEKNWKKMFSLRHRRLAKEGEDTEDEGEQHEEGEATDSLSKEEEPTDRDEEPKETEEAEKDEEAEKQATIVAAKTQLEELQEKLRQLTDQKHDKFLQLKEILVQEARSKSSGGGANPAKKRRVEDGSFSSPGPTSAPVFSSPESAAPASTPAQGVSQESSH